jgi:Ca2+-binding EF-hand superfamily protein
MTDLQQKKLAALFRLVDQDKDGFWERADIDGLVDRLAAIRDWRPGSPEHDAMRGFYVAMWEALERAADENHDRRVSLEEATRLLDDAVRGGPEAIKQWSRVMFDTLDADYDGEISPAEYRQMLAVGALDAAVADAIFPKLDLNGDGHISAAEFDQLYLEFFTSDDAAAPGNLLFGPLG